MYARRLARIAMLSIALSACSGAEREDSDADESQNANEASAEQEEGSQEPELPDPGDEQPKDGSSGSSSQSPEAGEPEPSTQDSPESKESSKKDQPKGDGPAGSCGEGGKIGSIEKVSLEGSGDRHYFVGVPNKEGPLPMVVAFHGDEGSPNAVRSFWTPVWRKEQAFILVMTQCPGCKSWYKGDTKANAQYLWDVLEDVGDNYNVDVSRIYGIGYSGGSVFLALHGFEFQSVFAGIQWHCGGGRGYAKPPREDCKVAGRIVISKDDFLWDSAKTVEKSLKSNDHQVEFVTAQCEGHCCHTNDLAAGAWAWMQKQSKCGGEVGGECAELTDLP